MGEQDHFVYSKAVVCSDVASSLPGAALRMAEPGQGVDLEKARLQHEKFTEVLKVNFNRVKGHAKPPFTGFEDSCEGDTCDSS